MPHKGARRYAEGVRYFSRDRLTFDLDDSAGPDAREAGDGDEIVVLTETGHHQP